MRVNHYLNITVISATLLFFVLWQPAAAGPPEKPGNSGLPGCLAKASELNDIVANQQETIEQQAARIEELEAMLKNFAAVPQTGMKESYAEGDDGDLQMGLQWPDPRFTDNGDGTVTDNLTRLIWLKNADCFGAFSEISWWDALDLCKNLADGQCGLSDGSYPGDWRFPNIRELYSLIDFSRSNPALPAGNPFSWSQFYQIIWTSTGDSGMASEVEILLGGDVWKEYKLARRGVWPVRGGNR